MSGRVIRLSSIIARASWVALGVRPASASSALRALLDQKDPLRRLRRKQKRGSMRRVRPPGPSRAAGSDRTEASRRIASRRIPGHVRDAVLSRDDGRCAFIGTGGNRCRQRGGLEFDHIVPWALGGRSDVLSNIRLLCREHHQSEARQVFGAEFLRRRIGREGRRPGAGRRTR